jgi:mannose-1-phosphate guanylyltransferase
MDRTLVAVVLAGGVGSRLYPASRSDRPKQFLSFGGDDSLLARTVERASFADEVVVVTRPAFAEEAREHAPDASVLVEPRGRDTGPALAYATHRVRERFGDAVVLALPSDHRVEGDFEAAAREGARVASEAGVLVTFGVEPTRPATGYGYVEPGRPIEGASGASDVARFHEKPDRETAARYVEAGHYWNAGIFAWTPETFLGEARDSPLAPLVDALEAGDPEAGFDAVDAVPVDRAVFERTDRAAVLPVGFEWDDLGSWDALARVLDAGDDGTVALGEALTLDAGDNVVASDGKHVSVVGASDLVVAAFDDRVLVVPKSEAQRVREVVAALRESGRF